MARIALIGTLDTKGHEHAFLAQIIRERGHEPVLIDVGTGGPPVVTPNVPRETVAEVGGIDLDGLRDRRDRGESVSAMATAATKILTALAARGEIDGVIALGGGGGTAIATAGMRALPLGFPKVMVSTLASGNTAQYIGAKDIVMIPAVVDVAGINRVSRPILARAAGAICGMVEVRVPESDGDERPLIAASMFGNTTECVQAARAILEDAGYEVLVFHATGAGGRAMEALIESGWCSGVLDITTTEWADEWVGGVLSAGPTRLDAAGTTGTPAIVAPGCLDMVNFGAIETVPERFSGRLFYKHNPQVTLMRTTPEECRELGRIVAEKLAAYKAPVTLLLPLRGVSVISAEGGPFHDPVADRALFDGIRDHLPPNVVLRELDTTINDPAFASACATELLANMKSKTT